MTITKTFFLVILTTSLLFSFTVSAGLRLNTGDSNSKTTSPTQDQASNAFAKQIQVMNKKIKELPEIFTGREYKLGLFCLPNMRTVALEIAELKKDQGFVSKYQKDISKRVTLKNLYKFWNVPITSNQIADVKNRKKEPLKLIKNNGFEKIIDHTFEVNSSLGTKARYQVFYSFNYPVEPLAYLKFKIFIVDKNKTTLVVEKKQVLLGGSQDKFSLTQPLYDRSQITKFGEVSSVGITCTTKPYFITEESQMAFLEFDSIQQVFQVYKEMGLIAPAK